MSELPSMPTQSAGDTQIHAGGYGGFLRSPALGLAADVVDDLEKVRDANQNRLRQLTRVGVDKDGKNRGFGLGENHPDVVRLKIIVDALAASYEDAVKNLQKLMRQHPLWPWAKGIVGVGEKQFARLLAAIGDPYWHDRDDRPCLVSELWSYTGYSVVEGEAPRRQRGVKSNWSPTARMRMRLISESIIKQRHSSYRSIYDKTRAVYAEAVHTTPCQQCAGKGKTPFPVGSPLRPGHQDARALRAVSKALLKDLWVESRRLHEDFPPPAGAWMIPGLDG